METAIANGRTSCVATRATEPSTSSTLLSPGHSLLAGTLTTTWGKLAAEGEQRKRSETDHGWGECLREHRDFVANGGNAVFVPFGLEISGGRGSEADDFWQLMLTWARQRHDPSHYHWAAPSFRQYWAQRFGTELVRSRGRAAWGSADRHPEHLRASGHASMAPEGGGSASEGEP